MIIAAERNLGRRDLSVVGVTPSTYARRGMCRGTHAKLGGEMSTTFLQVIT